MKLSKRLASLRKAKKSSLLAVSSRCKCSPQYLHKLENGHALRPDIDLLYKLSAYYQFPSDILIVEAEKVPQDIYWKIVQNPHLISVIRQL